MTTTETFPLSPDDMRIARREDEYAVWMAANEDISDMLRFMLDNGPDSGAY